MSDFALLVAGLEKSDPEAYQHIRQACDVVKKTITDYGFNHVALSFNGGKDSTVVLHLTRLALSELFGEGEEAEGRTIDQLRMVYFDKKDEEFKQVHEFMEEMRTKYKLKLEYIHLAYKEGLEQVLREGCKAVLMGQRSTDPFADHLSHFSMCDEGWPQVMRVNPILQWGYRHVWVFLRECSLAYCGLYDQGFTSLGPVSDTSANPMLTQGDAPPRPAYELHEDHHDQERCGRAPTPPKTPPSTYTATTEETATSETTTTTAASTEQ